MAQYFEYKYETSGHYVLYDRTDFEDFKIDAINAIDDMMEYLREAREKINAVTPGYDNEDRSLDRLALGIYGEVDAGGITETYGCCVRAVDRIGMFIKVVDNLHMQEKCKGEIEKYWYHFR